VINYLQPLTSQLYKASVRYPAAIIALMVILVETKLDTEYRKSIPDKSSIEILYLFTNDPALMTRGKTRAAWKNSTVYIQAPILPHGTPGPLLTETDGAGG